MATTVIEQVAGELVGETSHAIRLKLTIEEVWVGKSDRPASRTLLDIEPLSLSGVKDGRYTLRYVFDGTQQEQAVRVSFGFMLEG